MKLCSQPDTAHCDIFVEPYLSTSQYIVSGSFHFFFFVQKISCPVCLVSVWTSAFCQKMTADFFRFLVNLTKKWNEPDTSHLQTIEITFNVLCLRSLLLIHIGVKIKSFGSFLLLKFRIFFCHLLPWHFVMWHGSHNWGYVFNWHSNLFHWISFPKKRIECHIYSMYCSRDSFTNSRS